MRRRHVALPVLLASLVLAFVLVGCGGGDESSEGGDTGAAAGGGGGEAAPINLAFSTWNGYIGLVIGVEEGFFEQAGVKVEYTVIEDPVQRFNAFKAGRLNAIATTVDTFSRTYAKGIPSVQVLGLDASVGGDGIVANKDIASPAQLKGQQVAVSEGSTSQWLLAYVLDQNGLSLDDVKQTDLTSADAGAAFAAGRVPVAVTWEPWLSRAEENPDGHVLVSTEKYPDIITDQVAFSPDFVKEHPDSVRAFIKGYAMAIDFLRTNEDEALDDVTEYLGQEPDDIKAIMETVPIWTIDESKQYYGTADSPGPIYDVFTESAEFWKTIGEIDTVPDPKQAIDPSFLQEFSG
jgi:NitT/TauT family transport system substrate-binding protein